jgi:CubicO group peptidase (beta-lactamase class C family)
MSAQTHLQSTADRLVTVVPSGAPKGAHPPAGVVVGSSIAGRNSIAASGIAVPSTGLAMSREIRHDIASVSKVLGTTTALLRLASEGTLDLDSAVVRIVAGYPASSDTTVRDLLHHRAGLWEWQPLYLAPGVRDDPYAVLDSIGPRYEPGVGRHYSDLGFMYLGRVVETLGGGALPDVLQELVFDPLGLGNTGFGPTAGAVAASSRGDAVERRMVATHDPYPTMWSGEGFTWRDGELVGEANDGNCHHAFRGIAGHAGVFSTVGDLLSFGAALSGYRERPDLWSEAVAEEFFAPGPDPEQALGFRVSEFEVDGDRMPLVWHPGFTGCAVGFVPSRGISMAFASNRLLGGDTPVSTDLLWQQVRAAVAAQLMGLPVADALHAATAPTSSTNQSMRTP